VPLALDVDLVVPVVALLDPADAVVDPEVAPVEPTAAVADAEPPLVVVTCVAPGGGGGATPFVTPHVGEVAPDWTSAGVKSPHEYAEFSADVGLTAPGTSAVTWSIPYRSSDRPRLA
jgi:hypothetical protein